MTGNARALALVAALIVTAPLSATIQRTFVSSSGLDTAPCSRTAPCRNFSAAIAQTTEGGEVVVLDSAGYGAIPAIDKSITIVAPGGVHAAITGFTIDGITVNAPGATVVLRNIFLTGLGADTAVMVTDTGSLVADHLWINGFTNGIVFGPAGDAKLFVSDSVIRRLGGYAVHVIPTTSVFASILGCRLEESLAGLIVESGTTVNVRDTMATSNGNGFTSNSTGVLSTQMALENCTTSGNNFGIVAVQAASSNTTVRVSNSVITFNSIYGLLTGGAGSPSILTRQNNTLEQNGTDGNFTGTYSAK
jgi:hypothetical protein